MNAIDTFKAAGLPSVESLTAALRNIQPSVPGGDTALLKMDKTGHWVFGADQTEVEDDSLWAVNPFSFVHGYIAWGEGVPLGERMVSVAKPLPELDAPPQGAKNGWEMQIGFALACTKGEDEGLQVRYSATSSGGKRAAQTLAVTIADQVDKAPNKPVPVVRLKKEHYQHKSYGRIFTPVFEIVDWLPLDTGAADGDGEAPAEADGTQGRRRRRAAS
jgi:hypothetical protein